MKLTHRHTSNYYDGDLEFTAYDPEGRTIFASIIETSPQQYYLYIATPASEDELDRYEEGTIDLRELMTSHADEWYVVHVSDEGVIHAERQHTPIESSKFLPLPNNFC